MLKVEPQVTVFSFQMKRKTSSVKNRKSEIAILIQYTFVNTYMTILIALFHNGGIRIYNHSISFHASDMFLDMTDPRVLASMNTAWICWSYLNPVMLLILNK